MVGKIFDLNNKNSTVKKEKEKKEITNEKGHDNNLLSLK